MTGRCRRRRRMTLVGGREDLAGYSCYEKIGKAPRGAAGPARWTLWVEPVRIPGCLGSFACPTPRPFSRGGVRNQLPPSAAQCLHHLSPSLSLRPSSILGLPGRPFLRPPEKERISFLPPRSTQNQLLSFLPSLPLPSNPLLLRPPPLKRRDGDSTIVPLAKNMHPSIVLRTYLYSRYIYVEVIDV